MQSDGACRRPGVSPEMGLSPAKCPLLPSASGRDRGTDVRGIEADVLLMFYSE